MKKISYLSILLIAPLLFACNNKKSSSSEEDDLPSDCVRVKMPSYLVSDKDEYDLIIHFDDNYFNDDADTFSNDLARLSYGSSLVGIKREYAQAFYKRLGFEESYYPPYFDEETDENGIAYYIAHKKIDNYDVLGISVRGFDYVKEWSSNLYIGLEGDHAGFSNAASEIREQLDNIVSKNNYTNVKLWICGYSRAGAVSNVLASQLLRDDTYNSLYNEKNMFVYTFEAPKGLTEEHAVAYPNVFNITNYKDIVTYIPFEQWGFYRCGIDIHLVDEDTNIDKIAYAFDKNISLPEFTISKNNYQNEQEMIAYVINSLISTDADEEYKVTTRSDFVNNYQDTFRYAVSLIFSLPDSTLNKMLNTFSEMELIDMIALLGEDGIYNFIKPILDEDKVSYDDEELHSHCAVLTNFLQTYLSTLTSFVGNSNIMRIIDMHMPEIEYSLLDNYLLNNL